LACSPSYKECACTFTESRLAAWLELRLIQLAFSLDIGVNKNMANLPGEDYSETNLGCIYLVPVRTHITTQDDFKKVHVSAYNKKKELIDAGDYEKGKHQSPAQRKKQVPALRKAYTKKPDSARKWVGNRRQSDAQLQQDFQLRFRTLGGVGIVSPQKAILHCRTKTNFFGKWDTRLRAVSMAKMNRWTQLACHSTR
jgi:hypothetical protein